MGTTRARRVVIGVLVGVATLAVPGDASASCIGRSLKIDHLTGPPGDVVQVDGDGFGTACNDTIVNGSTAGPALGEPARGITLTFRQAGVTVPLVTVDAGQDYRFSVRVTIPPTAVAGAGFISYTGTVPVESLTFIVAGDPVGAATSPPTVLSGELGTATTPAPPATRSTAVPTATPDSTPAATTRSSRTGVVVVLAVAAAALVGALTALVRRAVGRRGQDRSGPGVRARER